MAATNRAYQNPGPHVGRDKLVLSHLWLVRHIVGKMVGHFPMGMEQDDLESAGLYGLLDAASRFDPAKSDNFRNYASKRIQGEIWDEIRRYCPLSQYYMDQVHPFRQLQQTMSAQTPTAELAEQLGWSHQKVVACQATLERVRFVRLEWPDAVEADTTERPEIRAQVAERKTLLAQALMALPDRERTIISLYYLEDLRLKEIGEILHIGEPWVSRILNRATRRMKSFIDAREA